jgi:PAS domain S-box-containing protein
MERSVRVLHVDDEPGFADLAASFLERENDRLNVETAGSASEALDCLEGTAVDCVVSDYDMPGRNGIEFLEAVRADHPDLPFVLFTGKGSEEVASDAISAGVTDYLQKGSGTDQYALLANRIVNAVERHRAEREVETTRQRFQTLLADAADYIQVLDAGGTIEYVTPSVTRVLGYDPGALRGREALDLIHPEDRECAVAQFEETVAEPEGQSTIEVRVQHEDGSWRWVEVRSRNLLADPDVEGVVGNVRDVTERKESEAAVDWHRTVIRNMGEGVYVFDADHELQFVNYRAEDTEGISEADWTGRNVSYLAEIDVLTTEETARIGEAIDRVLGGDTEEARVGVEPAIPESTETVELRLRRLGEEDLGLGTTRDVTDRARRERQQTATVDLLGTLYDLTRAEGLAFAEGVDRLLAAGREALGLPIGFLTRIDRSQGDADGGRQTVVHAVGSHELLEAGESCPLSEAYCRRVLESDGLLAVDDAVASGWDGDPAHDRFGLGCYVGGEVVVEGELYGALCFASVDARDAPFSDAERTLVRVMSAWVGYELERADAGSGANDSR